MNEIINAYFQGEKLKRKTSDSPNGFVIFEPHKLAQNTAYTDRLIDIILNPDDWELYQEPKKAWIYTTDFVAKEFPILNDNLRSGAIALTREFLKRYTKAMGYDVKDSSVYTVLIELVGASNLE